MKAKPVIPHEQANRDVDEVVTYYSAEANEAAMALGFLDALEIAIPQYQSSNTSPRTRLNSRVLCVTSVAFAAFAVPAMSTS